MGFTLFCEENLFGGILNWAFLGFYPGAPRGLVRRGANSVCFG
jgi:hypothetical protein